MSKILPIDPSQAQPKSAELLAGVAKMLGATPNLFRVTAHSPSALESMVAQFGAAAHGRLPAKTREAIALLVAEANGCDYCLSAHTALGKGAGLSDGEMTAARDVKPKYGPLITPFLTNKLHYRISPPSQSMLVATASPAAPAKAYGSPPGASLA